MTGQQIGFSFDAPCVVPDPCRRKHGGNANSEAANERIHPFKSQDAERIRLQIVACKEHGCTPNEIKIWNDRERRFKYPNEYSGRFKELRDAGVIFKSGRKRDGGDVHVSDRKWVNGSSEAGQ